MSRHRFSLFACIALAVSICSSAGAAAITAVTRFVDVLLETLASPQRLAIAGDFEPAAPISFQPSGIPQHDLRHEAGTSRRAADRHT